MKFLKSAKSNKNGFSAKFTNGEATESHSAASFFMAMQDKEATAEDLDGYIHIGQMCDPSQDWDEITRIAKTFADNS